VSGLRSLRWRLALWIAAVLVLAVAATFVAIYRGTGSELRAQVDRELQADSQAFLHRGLPAGANATPQAVEKAARSYVGGQPFRATARLLYVRTVGGRLVTNEPELLGPQPDDGETPARQSSENVEGQALLRAPDGYSTVRIADVGEIRVLTTPVMSGGRRVATLGVGEPLESAERAQRGVATTFLLAGTLTLIAALIAAFVVATRTARPLRRMAALAARVDGGDLSPRMESGGPRDEIRVLAESFDHMLERLEDAFARQRQFVADASHELRTPLTVIRGQLEVLARQDEPTREDVERVEGLVRTEVLRMQRLVDDLLLLARADERGFLEPRTIDIGPFAGELLDGMSATADRRFELGELPEGQIVVDPDRLAQALRNLLRNAIEHTAPGGLVRLAGSAAGGRLTLTVDDDGPGIALEQRERVFDRFHRTDPARSRAEGGMGLGLSIAQAIVAGHGGTIRALESPQGGARIAIELPGFEPGAERDARAIRAFSQNA
jgi:two-component system OmpR family sensor kinase